MDLNDYWQENKRFVVSVASGVILFVIGSMVVDSFFTSKLQVEERNAKSDADKLARTPWYGANEQRQAEAQNQALIASIAALSQAVEFQSRPRFVLDAAKGPATNQYFGTVSAVREELLRAAGRANLRLPEDLGLPALSPTREQEIQKVLEALDLEERFIRLAIEAGVERIERIEIKLDPGLSSRQGVGEVEKTRVSFVASGAPQPLVRLMLLSQSRSEPNAAVGPLPLMLERAELNPARNKPEEATLEAVLCVVRLHQKSEE